MNQLLLVIALCLVQISGMAQRYIYTVRCQPCSVYRYNIDTEIEEELLALPIGAVPFKQSTFDYVNGKYLFQFANTTNATLVFDVNSWQLTDTLPLLVETEYSRSANRFFGLRRDSSNTGVWFCAMDYGSMTIDTISHINSTGQVEQGSSTFDAQNDRYFVQIDSTMMVVDATTGNLLTSWPTDEWTGLEYDPYTDRLYGFKEFAWQTDTRFGYLDPQTGAAQDFGTLAGVAEVYPEYGTPDFENRFYYVYSSSGFIEFDLNTAQITNVNLYGGNWEWEYSHSAALKVPDTDQPDVEVTIYPQPATDEITVRTTLESPEYAIYDPQGKLIRLGQLNRSQSISVSDLPTGLYLLHLWNSASSVSKKVVVNRL